MAEEGVREEGKEGDYDVLAGKQRYDQLRVYQG